MSFTFVRLNPQDNPLKSVPLLPVFYRWENRHRLVRSLAGDLTSWRIWKPEFKPTWLGCKMLLLSPRPTNADHEGSTELAGETSLKSQLRMILRSLLMRVHLVWKLQVHLGYNLTLTECSLSSSHAFNPLKPTSSYPSQWSWYSQRIPSNNSGQ